MMKDIAQLASPHIAKESKLNRIVAATFNQSVKSELATENDSFWNARYFQLDQVQIFQEATEAEKKAIASQCNQQLLEESYFIEKAGMSYMAKMVLLAETTEEKMLYAMFAADEATHFAQISRFFPSPPLATLDNAFLQFLTDLIDLENKVVLLFILQVVLEGWGLSHYRRLAKGCQNPYLKVILQSFLDSESRHHATGVTLLKQQPIPTESQTIIVEALVVFLRMIQVGPQGAIAAIERTKGHLSRSQKLRILEELQTEKHSGTRLKILHSLIGCHSFNILSKLEERGAFTPFPIHQCVSLQESLSLINLPQHP